MYMKRKAKFLFACCCAVAALLSAVSCGDSLEITQEYPFTVEAMPVQDEVACGETVELRLSIVEDGGFDGTVYTLRYFQTDGKGRLETEDGTVMKPNDRYLLGKREFRLYYTSLSVGEAQSVDLYVENNWGGVEKLTFDFNADDGDDEEDGGLIIRPIVTAVEDAP